MRRFDILLVLVVVLFAACSGNSGNYNNADYSDLGMNSVVVGGPGLVAVGYDRSGGDMDAAVWTSPDGIAWTRVPHDESVFGGHFAQSMNSVVAGGPGLVAVGRDILDGKTVAAVWTSPDGLTWTRVPHDGAVFGGADDHRMTSVVAWGPGQVAVGEEEHIENIIDSEAAVWTSPDGLTWARVPNNDAVFDGPRDQVMYSVIATDSGLVAVGYDRSGEDMDAAVWTSPDGLAWTRVHHDEEIFGGSGDQKMWSVVAWGPGLVAVGSGGYGIAAVWTSPDGFIWTRVPYDERIFGGSGFNSNLMTSVVVGGSGLVAVGYEGSIEYAETIKALVWTSPDGLTWTRVPYDQAIFDRQMMHSVIATSSGLVAVGRDFSDVGADAAVWTSSDGVTWFRVPHDEKVFGGDHNHPWFW